MNRVALAVLSLVTLAPPAEAACLTKAQARSQWPTEHLSWKGRGRCWYVRGKDAGAVPVRRFGKTATNDGQNADRADTKPVKTFAFIVKPGEEVVPNAYGSGNSSSQRDETRPQPDALAGADVPDSLTDDRPEAMLMPTRDQWTPEDDHSDALWLAFIAAVLSIATVGGMAWVPFRQAWRGIRAMGRLAS